MRFTTLQGFGMLCGGLVIAVTAVGLVSGAAWLNRDLFGTGLPLGTLATAASFVLLPGLAIPMLRSRVLRSYAVVLVIAGLLWLPVSALLAGNLRLSFTGAPDWWWPATQALPALSLPLWAWIALRPILVRWRSDDRDRG